MQELVIHGGRPLHGTVRANGAKNAALPIMAASLLMDGPTVLHRIPRLRDVQTMTEVLAGLGMSVEWTGPHSLRISPTADRPTTAPADRVRQMRGSACVLGPLLATRGAADLPRPGGCVLGERPIDLHLKGLRALGARIAEEDSWIRARADGLRGGRVHLAGPRGSTALGTANVMMAASLAAGRTVIMGAACEPEVQDLARFLSSLGARISGAGTRTLTIDGVDSLPGGEYEIIPDRIEAGTFLTAGAAAGGELTVEGACADDLAPVLDLLERAGVRLTVAGGAVTVSRDEPLRPISFATGPHPEVPTDMQPQLGALLCLAKGTSAVTERVYPERFTHVSELQAMGARILRSEGQAVIEGVECLQGAAVRAADIRAGAALVVAGLAAEGTTTISGVDQIDRGYQDLEERLRALGAQIYRRHTMPVSPQRKRPA